VTIALGIPHTPWVPERAQSMARLRKLLGEPLHHTDAAIREGAQPLHYREFIDRAANAVWSHQLWKWGYETGADHLLQLQDDAIVAPDFWPHLRAIIAAVPDKIIGLEAAHPRGRQIAKSGGRWYTTSDMLIGVGYVIPRELLGLSLRWREMALVDGWKLDEDMLIGIFCLTTGTRIWHPVPTIIDHDTDLASNYGHENHSHRRPSVTWSDPIVAGQNMSAPGFWEPSGVPHLGRFYSHTPALARRWVRGFDGYAYQRAIQDVWRGEVA
jgi:hypothetical protein